MDQQTYIINGLFLFTDTALLSDGTAFNDLERWVFITDELLIGIAGIVLFVFLRGHASRTMERSRSGVHLLIPFSILSLGVAAILNGIALYVPALFGLSLFSLSLAAILSILSVFFVIRFSSDLSAHATQDQLKDEIEKRKAAEERISYLTKNIEELISEKSAEAEAGERRFRAIFEHSSDAISLMDASFNGIYSNPAAYALTGRTEEESKSSSWMNLLHPDDSAEFKSMISSALTREGAVLHAAVRIRHKRKGYIDTEGTVCNLLNDKSVRAMVFNFRDITVVKKAERKIIQLNKDLERKVAERTRQLELANKELEAFSYSVSHDLRAPLRIINGYVDILDVDHKPDLSEECRRLLGVIQYNTQHMGRLIDALLNLSRMGRKSLVVQHADMEAIVKSTIEEQLMYYKSEVAFELGTIYPVDCDSVLIRHVWGNLISNAIKYSLKVQKPAVAIDSERRENDIVYSVRDNGVGFDMNYRSKLFGVFQRLHKMSEFEGTGIGLAIVQRIILKHGGSVWAESEPNNGATFYFSLPIKHEEYGHK